MHGSYVRTYVLFLFPAALLLGLNYQYLKNTGEFLSLPEIVSLQQNDPRYCIYGTALHADMLPYKLEGYRARRPRVAVAGSSFVQTFRERFFAEPFYSLGQTVDSTVNARLYLPLLFEEHKPELLFFSLNFWWFREDVRPYRRTHLTLETQRLTLEKLLRPFSWLLQGKVPVRDYLRITFSGNGLPGRCDIGVYSSEKRQGFAPDGSYYIMSVIEGRNQELASPKFARELQDIEQGRGHFIHASGINREAVEDIVRLIGDIEASGVKVIAFFPPVALRVYEEMQRHMEEYRYIPAAITALRARGIDVLDFLDPRSIGTNDCEFTDGDHMGDIASARLLRTIDDLSADPLVHTLLNRPAIDAAIAAYAGFGMIPDARVSNVPETDFLELGCPKRVSTGSGIPLL